MFRSPCHDFLLGEPEGFDDFCSFDGILFLVLKFATKEEVNGHVILSWTCRLVNADELDGSDVISRFLKYFPSDRVCDGLSFLDVSCRLVHDGIMIWWKFGWPFSNDQDFSVAFHETRDNDSRRVSFHIYLFNSTRSMFLVIPGSAVPSEFFITIPIR